MIILIFFIVMAYLLGSIPWGVILTRRFTSVDIVKSGSGNIGATNVWRSSGKLLGVLTLILDMLKGALPVYLGLSFISSTFIYREWGVSVIAWFAVLGHLYPIYTGFKNGGKGVATAAGCFLILSPWAFLFAVLTFAMFVVKYNHVSSGSLGAVMVLPIFVALLSRSIAFFSCAVLIGLFIVWKHRDNIRRLMTGTEPLVWKKQKKD